MVADDPNLKIPPLYRGVEICNLKHEAPTQPYDFCVDRGTPLGNPFLIAGALRRPHACTRYHAHFYAALLYEFRAREYLSKIKKALSLHGQVRLFCHCAPKQCHAETVKAWLESGGEVHASTRNPEATARRFASTNQGTVE